MEYRREIDGLRAVAVIPVILFHAGFELFSGGFVGVDVFFVISGYLITTIILAEKECGSFSLVNFYERRARRILPPLFFVMFVCIPFAWFWLMPSYYKDFSQSLVAVSFFSSNILFWLERGYFGAAAEMKPLLHTWSLAVEEQYYVLFPLFLMLVWHYRKRWIFGAIILLGVVSLLLAQWGTYNAPTAAFFLLPARAWELMIGASAAFYLLYGKGNKEHVANYRFISELLGLLGLALIAYSIFIFDETVPFPSFYALVPTLGAVLIILFSSQATIAGRLLANRILVGIGLVSYSAYLWHQPLFVFARHRSLTVISQVDYFILSILAFVLAYLTWRYIEKPFRNKNVISRTKIFICTVLCSVFFTGVGLFGHFNEGYIDRFPLNVASYLLGADDKNPNRNECGSSTGKYLHPKNACLLGSGEHIKGALLGDSHSDAIAYALGGALEGKGVGLKHMWYSGCPSILHLYRKDNKRKYRCNEYNNAVFGIVSKNDELDNIILVSRFTVFIEGDRFDNGEGGVELGAPVFIDGIEFKDKVRSEEQRINTVIERYVTGVKTLLDLGKNIILVYPVPEVGWDVPMYAAKSVIYSGSKVDVSTSYKQYLKRNEKTFAAFDAIGAHVNLKRVYPHKVFCNTYLQERCVATLNGRSLYYDDDHLSNYGAKMLIGDIISKMR